MSATTNETQLSLQAALGAVTDALPPPTTRGDGVPSSAPEPPCSNRGVTPPITPEWRPLLVDWLSVSLPIDTDVNALPEYLHGTKRVTPRLGYRWAYECRYGRYDVMGPTHEGSDYTPPEYGLGYQFTGDDLARMRADGISFRDLSRALPMATRCSRIDFALDVVGLAGVPQRIGDLFQAGQLPCRARKGSIVQGTGAAQGGYTAYLGARTSQAFMRAYDKAAQQGLRGIAWGRIELELKGSKAERAYTAAYLYGVHKAGSAHIADFVTLPEDITAHLDSVPPQLPEMGAPVKRDTMYWLEQSVKRAIVRHAEAEPARVLAWLAGVLHSIAAQDYDLTTTDVTSALGQLAQAAQGRYITRDGEVYGYVAK